MKYFLSVLVFLVLSGIVVGFNQKKELQQLEVDSSSLGTVSEKVEQLKAKNEKLRQLEVDGEELKRLREHTEELLKLRSEISKLRQVEDAVPEQLQSEVTQLRTQAQKEKERVEYLKAVLEYQDLSREVSESLYRVAGVVNYAAKVNNGDYPRSFQEVQAVLNYAPENSETDFYRESFSTLMAQNILTQFEFIALPFDPVPGEKGIPIFKLRNPMRMPDGQWARFYSFSEMIKSDVVLPENNFDEWERENFYSQ